MVKVHYNRATNQAMEVLLLYAVLAGAYLVVLPLATFFYLNLRWYNCYAWERVFMYFLVFLFFPGLLALSPFLNFRPQRRQIET
ncbi:NAD(P)H-quinone oxidoreductase subunit L [Kamptonema cortianum]|nr:NAD(P)H-quinone oxidoreductase subunit L [Kamptonema cortianum]